MKPNRGLTLIELMIVVAIVAILAAVALPSYQRHVTESRRTAAQACLMELAQFMERHYTTRMTYAGAVLPQTQCRTDLAGWYEFTLTPGAQPATQFTLSATPGTAQATADAACGTQTLNQAGTRGASGPNGAACWR